MNREEKKYVSIQSTNKESHRLMVGQDLTMCNYLQADGFFP